MNAPLLRDDGKLALDAPAESYIPELGRWSYPTQDSARIRVRDLLNHTAGFISDDPWGGRQTFLPECEFSQLLREGPSFARIPGTAAEYSNLGYALLGRIISNVSGQPFDVVIARKLLEPLSMTSSGFISDRVRVERQALGYSWNDDAWHSSLPYHMALSAQWAGCTAPWSTTPNGLSICCRHGLSVTSEIPDQWGGRRCVSSL